MLPPELLDSIPDVNLPGKTSIYSAAVPIDVATMLFARVHVYGVSTSLFFLIAFDSITAGLQNTVSTLKLECLQIAKS